jgi:DNA-binding beta-propeller fold protein YncE
MSVSRPSGAKSDEHTHTTEVCPNITGNGGYNAYVSLLNGNINEDGPGAVSVINYKTGEETDLISVGYGLYGMGTDPESNDIYVCNFTVV